MMNVFYSHSKYLLFKESILKAQKMELDKNKKDCYKYF